MMKRVLASMLVFSFAMQICQADESSALPAKEKFHLFLLAGQSNMAGRGKVGKEDQQIHPRVLMLTKNGEWKPAVDPLHFDKKSAGVGLGKSFALVLADQQKDVVIGLIPAACGGSPISTWQPGKTHRQTKSNPYDDALKRTKLAMQKGTFKGILWHQGESDSNPKSAPNYQKNLEELIARFRKEFNAPTLPFVIGQLGQFEQSPWNESKKTVNAAHQAIAKENATVGFVKSDGLTCKKDNVHFDAPSLRKFGRRYAEVYIELTKKN